MNDTAPNTKSESVSRRAKRAQWEAFEFSVCDNGIVNVCNNSHGADATGHTYSVDVIGDRVDNICSCPSAKYQEGRCKHEIAVRGNDVVMTALTASDGGQEACANGQVGCCGPEGDDLECFDCRLDSKQPHRSEPADFGGGKSTGVEEL